MGLTQAHPVTVTVNKTGLNGDVIFDNIVLKGSESSSSHGSSSSGLFANSHIMIMGTGITSVAKQYTMLCGGYLNDNNLS